MLQEMHMCLNTLVGLVHARFTSSKGDGAMERECASLEAYNQLMEIQNISSREISIAKRKAIAFKLCALGCFTQKLNQGFILPAL